MLLDIAIGSYIGNQVGSAQRNQDLANRIEHARKTTEAGVGACPSCAGGLPVHGVKKCKHCSTSLYWYEGFVSDHSLEHAKTAYLAHVNAKRREAFIKHCADLPPVMWRTVLAGAVGFFALCFVTDGTVDTVFAVGSYVVGLLITFAFECGIRIETVNANRERLEALYDSYAETINGVHRYKGTEIPFKTSSFMEQVKKGRIISSDMFRFEGSGTLWSTKDICKLLNFLDT